jgi:hypothetical protein
MNRLSKNRLAFIASLNLHKVTHQQVVDIWTKYETGIHQMIKSNGKPFALERYKCSYQYLRNYILQLPTQPVTFCKSDSNGLPKTLWPLRPLLKGDRTTERLALSIARTYELVTLPINYGDLDAITDNSPLESIKTQKMVSKKLRWFLKRFTNKYPWYLGSLQTPIEPWSKVGTTLSKGPNGPAVATSHLDAKAVVHDRVLYYNLRKLNNALKQNWITRWLEKQAFSFSTDLELFTGKLGFSSEPAGKTRRFSIGDYWSQLSLKPLQLSLQRTQESISTDCTSDQDRGFSTLLKKSIGKPTYCFDLSSASDRIPAKQQKIRLQLMGGKALADSWHQVMTNRDFYIKYTKRKVRWSVGQPLGLLSSFPSFALWHHDIVQLAANWELLHEDKPLKFFTDYALLGDDIVILDKKVADRYQWLLKKVDVPVNLTKSVIGDARNSQIEFTKRLALKGLEMSSIKANILSKNNILDMLDLVEILAKRDFITTDSGHCGLHPILKSEDFQRFRYLLWLRASDAPKLILTDQDGNASLTLTREDVIKKITHKRTEAIIKKSLEIKPLDMEVEKTHIEKQFTSSSIPYSETVLEDRSIGDLSGSHPLVLALTQTSRELQFIMFTVLDDLDPETVSPVEYLPIVSTKSYYHDRKAKVRYLSKILMDTFDECRKESTNVEVCTHVAKEATTGKIICRRKRKFGQYAPRTP